MPQEKPLSGETRSALSAEEPEDRLGMTEEQWQRFQEWTHGYGEQDENGIDLSLLRENLTLTPTERIEKMRRALALFLEVRHAGEVAGLSANSRRA